MANDPHHGDEAAPVAACDPAARLAVAIGASLRLAPADVELLRHFLQAVERIERDVHVLRGATGVHGAARTHEGPAPWIEPHA